VTLGARRLSTDLLGRFRFDGVPASQLHKRIEVMQGGVGTVAYIMRVYTRGYIARMTAGGVTLKPPAYVDTGRDKEPLCR